MEYGLKPLGREKFWLFALLAPTGIGLAFGAETQVRKSGIELSIWN